MQHVSGVLTVYREGVNTSLIHLILIVYNYNKTANILMLYVLGIGYNIINKWANNLRRVMRLRVHTGRGRAEHFFTL